jgi:hypothetical protein
MSITDHGIRSAAGRIGITVEEYKLHVGRNRKWCSLCQKWHPLRKFGNDKSTYDGRAASCRVALARRYKERKTIA